MVEVERAFTELKATAVGLRESHQEVAAKLEKLKGQVAECKGWVPSLDAAQLAQVCDLLMETLDLQSKLSDRTCTGVEQMIAACDQVIGGQQI